MKRIIFCISILLAGLSYAQAPAGSDDIDWDKAKALFQRSQSGETLTKEDQAYLDRAKQLRGQGRPPGQGAPGQGQGQRKAPERLIPLTDMSVGDRYEEQDGGLYGGGRNTPPDAHAAAAKAQLAEIRPLDSEGKPSLDGVIVFISISMSNATQEFSRFKQVADASPEKSAKVTIVDCAQGGQAMAEWVPEDARTWEVTAQRLEAAKVSPAQVQVAWVKLANKGPSGSLDEHGKKLESDTLKVLQNAKAKFPNLRIAYLGSRIWAGNAKGGLNPEPYAYESAFVTRWLIQRQMTGSDPELSLESTPLLLWGPYIWSEGERGRKFDDLVWELGDFAGDGVHPSQSGRDKVAQQLLKFCSTDPLAKSWFVGAE